MDKFSKYDLNELTRAVDQMVDSFATIEYYAKLVNSRAFIDTEVLGPVSAFLDMGNGYEPVRWDDLLTAFDLIEQMKEMVDDGLDDY